MECVKTSKRFSQVWRGARAATLLSPSLIKYKQRDIRASIDSKQKELFQSADYTQGRSKPWKLGET